MGANYSNVAVPGTGIPLSIGARFQIVARLFLILLYPMLCLFAALHNALYLQDDKNTPLATRWARAYHEQLLEPQDWFSFWRINSRVAAWHSYVLSGGAPMGHESYGDYNMENKWDFIKKGLELGIPISPIEEMSGICVKHKNEEGGMGIHFYKNALNGGDWIIQKVLTNDSFVSSCLPNPAPLSTFRLMTGSLRGAGGGNAKVIAAVFRAGRKGASTDHSSVLFDVDVATGKIKRGTRNAQWYVLGPKALTSPWGPPQDELKHPDGEDIFVTGKQIPNWESLKKVVSDAHDKMIAKVPLVGWDVVLSAEYGVCLLEANLSCNFLRGSFNQPEYFAFIDKYHRYCEEQETGLLKQGRGAIFYSCHYLFRFELLTI